MWEIHLTMTINFSFIHSKSDTKEIMINDEVDEVIK